MSNPIVVIGSGIIGSAIARELSMRTKEAVVVLEKENTFGLHASGRNSGVIHSGINHDPAAKPLKARMCVEGSAMLREYAQKKNVPMHECGTLVVAQNAREKKGLEQLLTWAQQAKVPGVRMLSLPELYEYEPSAVGDSALYAPTGAVIDSKRLLESIIDDAQENGAEWRYGVSIKSGFGELVETSDGLLEAKHVINCAGLHADTIAHMWGVGGDYSILPFRGDYVTVPATIRSMIYQVPDPNFPVLGVHLTKSVSGEVLAGPTAALSLAGREGYERGVSYRGLVDLARDKGFIRWAKGALSKGTTIRQVAKNAYLAHSKKAFVKEVKKIYSGTINPGDCKTHPSGIRAQVVDRNGNLIDDFLVKKGERSTHILNAVSPGMTCSLAFAQYVVDEYVLPNI